MLPRFSKFVKLTKITKILNLFLTILRRKPEIPATREISTPPTREISHPKPITDSLACPYCSSANFVRRGFRQNVREKVQLYLCQKCQKTFTQKEVKGKHYPLSVIFDAISIYNLGYSLEDTARIMEKRIQKSVGANHDSPASTPSASPSATPVQTPNLGVSTTATPSATPTPVQTPNLGVSTTHKLILNYQKNA